ADHSITSLHQSLRGFCPRETNHRLSPRTTVRAGVALDTVSNLLIALQPRSPLAGLFTTYLFYFYLLAGVTSPGHHGATKIIRHAGHHTALFIDLGASLPAIDPPQSRWPIQRSSGG